MFALRILQSNNSNYNNYTKQISSVMQMSRLYHNNIYYNQQRNNNNNNNNNNSNNNNNNSNNNSNNSRQREAETELSNLEFAANSLTVGASGLFTVGRNRGPMRGYNVEDINTRSLHDETLQVRRVGKVTKAGRMTRLQAWSVCGNQRGFVGFGKGKDETASKAIRKAILDSRKNFTYVPVDENGRLPCSAMAFHGATKVELFATKRKEGLSGAKTLTSALRLAGVKHATVKTHGSGNVHNALGALFRCISKLKTIQEVAEEKGLRVIDLRRARAELKLIKGKLELQQQSPEQQQQQRQKNFEKNRPRSQTQFEESKQMKYSKPIF